MMPPKPEIRMSRELAIGYRKPLAKTGAEIELGAGTHFLLARNGRGKTTLLRTLAGTLRPLEGSFRKRGFLQYLPEDVRFDDEISAATIFRALLPREVLKAALKLAEEVELDVSKNYGQLSTGNRRKTNLILVEYSVRPGVGNILLLDEPFSGLDAHARGAFEALWRASQDDVLRLVSCHPDYDSMTMPSALLIQQGEISFLDDPAQTWSQLKTQLN
jgi:ABC-type multidrug transport system ATPase subunit